MTDSAPTREAIKRATYTAVHATDAFVVDQDHQLRACSSATRHALIVQFVITHLASNGLISIAPVEQFEEWIPMELEQPFADDMLAEVRAGVEAQARITAAMAAMR